MPKSRHRSKPDKGKISGVQARGRRKNCVVTMLTGQVNGKLAASAMKANACERRKAESLCQCADDLRVYASQAELETDKTKDAVICEHCGKERLRIWIVNAELAGILRSAPAEKARDYLLAIQKLYK